jgi:hypothetical protein
LRLTTLFSKEIKKPSIQEGGTNTNTKKDKTVEDVIESSDQLNLKSLSKSVTKYYICFPKQLVEMNI